MKVSFSCTLRNIVFGLVLLLGCQESPGVATYGNLQEAREIALRNNTCLLVIFDWHGSPTRFLDEWLADPEVILLLKNVVTARLMCDDRQPFNAIETVGAYNSRFQAETTGKNTQPLFCFYSPQGALLTEPLAYCPKEQFLTYLRNRPNLPEN